MVIGNDSLGYPIFVCENAEQPLRSFVRGRGMRCIVLADAQPAVLARARALAVRLPRCLGVLPIVLGEPRKRLARIEEIADALIAAGADRSTLIVGVGGGVATARYAGRSGPRAARRRPRRVDRLSRGGAAAARRGRARCR